MFDDLGAPSTLVAMFNPSVLLGHHLDRDSIFAILKWVGGLSATAATGLLFKFSRRSRSVFLNIFRNLPQKTALGEARRYFGPGVAEVVPFRVPGVRDQYIAVLKGGASEPVAFRGWLVVLRGRRGRYESIETPVGQLRYGPRYTEHFGVADVSGDGGRDIFVVSYSAGSGASSVDVDLYDVGTAERYRITLFQTYDAAPPVITYAGDFSTKPEARVWLREHAARVSALYEVAPRNRADRLFRNAESEWPAKHGTGFVEGTIQPEFHHGAMPRLDEAHCVVDDGEYVWASFFKGPVMGYRKSSKRYFTLFVPPTQYHWVTDIVVGERFLWLQTHSAIDPPRGLLVVQREDFRMQVMPIRANAPVRKRFFDIFLSGSLSLDGGELRLSGVPIELPEGIDPRSEFQSLRRAEQVWAGPN